MGGGGRQGDNEMWLFRECGFESGLATSLPLPLIVLLISNNSVRNKSLDV